MFNAKQIIASREGSYRFWDGHKPDDAQYAEAKMIEAESCVASLARLACKALGSNSPHTFVEYCRAAAPFEQQRLFWKEHLEMLDLTDPARIAAE